MTTTTKVTYVHTQPYHSSGGVVDAGPHANVWLDLNGTLYMRGPTVNYSVEHVASFDVEDVEI